MKSNIHDKIGVVEAMMLLQELHQQGYQKLRWYSYVAPNGLFLRCHITTEDNLQYNEDCVGIKNIKEDTWADSFGIPSTGNDVKSLVEEFKEELKCFIDKGKGEDPEYARWFDDLVEKAKEGKFPKYSEIYVDIPYHSIMVGKEFIKIPVTRKLTEEIEIPDIPTFVEEMYQSKDDEKQIMMQSEEFYQYKKVFFKECAVAGVSFHLKYDDELWETLEIGTKLALVRQKDNKHDKNAVAVALADDYEGNPEDFDFDFIIGYVPRSENAELATLLDAGYGNKFSAEITTLKTHGNLNDRIRITIYLETNDKVLVRPDRLRAQSINEQELSDMIYQLNLKGCYNVLFGYEDYSRQEILPSLGEKIVFVHRDTNREILFLMMVTEEGDSYIKCEDREINYDVLRAWKLSNIMGPIYIKKSDYNFLYGEDLKDCHAEYYLNKDVSDGFKEIFEKELFRTINPEQH